MKKNHSILKPTYYYLVLLVAFYFFRDVLLFPNSELWLSIPLNLAIEIIIPLVLFVWNFVLFRKYNKDAKALYVFMITGIPGFLIGAQVAYGFIGGIMSGEAGLVLLDQISIIIVGALLGSFFGLVGLLLNKTLKLLKP